MCEEQDHQRWLSRRNKYQFGAERMVSFWLPPGWRNFEYAFYFEYAFVAFMEVSLYNL